MRRTLLVLLCGGLFLAPLWGQTPDDKKATIAFVQQLQQKDGGFLPAPAGSAPAKSSLRATTGALRALKYFGGDAKDRATAVRLVASCYDPDAGAFADTPGGKPNVLTTAVGLMAVVELKMPPEKYVEPCIKYIGANAKTFEDIRIAAAGLEAVGKRSLRDEAWLQQIAKLRNPDGTYGKGAGTARATGGSVAAVLRLGGKVEQRENMVKALKAGQRADGGFGKEEEPGSDLETSYRVTRTFHMLKEKPDEAKLRAFVGKCRNADGGYGIAPGKPSSVGSTYFASIILHWLDEK